jgi:hypothetical protein
MEPECSLSCIEEPETGPYFEPLIPQEKGSVKYFVTCWYFNVRRCWHPAQQLYWWTTVHSVIYVLNYTSYLTDVSSICKFNTRHTMLRRDQHNMGHITANTRVGTLIMATLL